jgi:hypothetical protein
VSTQYTMKTKDADVSQASRHESSTKALKQTGQRELGGGVLKQAAHDLRRFHGATSNIERELYLDAYRWLTIDECSSPFSFLNVCQLLDFAPDSACLELIVDLSLGAFRCRIQRGKRAAGRFWMSLSQLFMSARDANASARLGRAEPANTIFHRTNSMGGAV